MSVCYTPLKGLMSMLYFGDKLKALRSGKGWSQRQLAEKVDLVDATISGYESGAKYPSVEVLIKLCSLFNVSSDYLLGLSDSMELKMSALTDDQAQVIMRLIAELEQYNYLKDKM